MSGPSLEAADGSDPADGCDPVVGSDPTGGRDQVDVCGPAGPRSEIDEVARGERDAPPADELRT